MLKIMVVHKGLFACCDINCDLYYVEKPSRMENDVDYVPSVFPSQNLKHQRLTPTCVCHYQRLICKEEVRHSSLQKAHQ